MYHSAIAIKHLGMSKLESPRAHAHGEGEYNNGLVIGEKDITQKIICTYLASERFLS